MNPTSSLSLLVDLTKRDFKLRYLGSLLGVSWNVIHPLVMIFIYTIVFSSVMKVKLGSTGGVFSYGLYLCSGILAWQAFLETLTRSVSVLLDNAQFLKKVSFPPLILFGSTYLASLINYGFGFVFFTGFSIYAGTFSPLGFLLGVVVVMLFNLFAMGLGIALGCLNVFMRDVQQFTNVFVQLWFWGTPIVYLVDLLPAFAVDILRWNPAYYYIEALHKLMYYQSMPGLTSWFAMVGAAVVSLLVGLWFYRRCISEVRDEL